MEYPLRQTRDKTEIRKHPPRPGRIQCDVFDSISLELLGHITCPPYYTGTRHSHPFWEIIYVTGGSGVFSYRSRKYPVTRGDFFLFEPHGKHLFSSTSEEAYANLYLGFSFKQLPANRLKRPIPFHLSAQPGVSLIKSGLAAICAGIIRDEKRLQSRRGLAMEVLARVVNLLTEPDNSVSHDDTQRAVVVGRAREFLVTNAHRAITTREVTGLFHLSPHYAADLFKQGTGLSIKEYHHGLRMEEAHRLLRNTSLSIGAVGERLGFESIHYFSRRFKDYYKVSPARVRPDR